MFVTMSSLRILSSQTTKLVLYVISALISLAINTNVCSADVVHDFMDDPAITNFAAVICVLNSHNDRFVSISCPDRVGDVNYTWHPRSSNDSYIERNAYISSQHGLETRPVSEIIISESVAPIWIFDRGINSTTFNIYVQRDEHYIMTENRLMLLCGPVDLELTPTLVSYLTNTVDLDHSHTIRRNTYSSLTRALDKYSSGIGVVYLRRNSFHHPLMGCGSRASPLFRNPNDVIIDEATGLRTCVVDPMSTLPIGFLCEGEIEPPDCFRYLISDNNYVHHPLVHRYMTAYNDTLLIVQPFVYLASPLIEGYCVCRDRVNSEVVAKLIVKPRYEYVCDINNMLMKNRLKYIRHFWCSFVLHPGSNVTIKFPADSDIILDDDGDEQIELKDDTPPNLFYTTFNPSSLRKLRILGSTKWNNHVLKRHYSEKLAGDALTLDVSNARKGVVKLSYDINKPLTMIGSYDSLCFYWRLLPRVNYPFEHIFATIRITLSLTHPYDVVGCETGEMRIFDPQSARRRCVWKSYTGIRRFYRQCIIHHNSGVIRTGIYCKPGEILMPANCSESAFDLSTGGSLPWPPSITNMHMRKVDGLQMFKFTINPIEVFSLSCNCITDRGIATSQLILESTYHEHNVLLIRPLFSAQRNERHIYVNKSDIIYDPSPSDDFLVSIKVNHEGRSISPGNTYSYECRYVYGSALSREWSSIFEQRYIEGSNSWLPRSLRWRYFEKIRRGSTYHLRSVNYNEYITGEKNTLVVKIKKNIGEENEMLEFSYRSSGILISKDPNNANSLSFHYLCGLRPDVGYGLVDRISEVDRERLNITDLRYPSGTYKLLEMVVVTTDPYVHGCGVTFTGEEIFKPDTVHITDANDGSSGCQVDLSEHRECGFYCPPPYVIDPPLCFQDVLVDGVVTPLSDISDSMVYHKSTHFSLLSLHHSHKQYNQERKMSPPLQCRCLSITGEVISTINIVNYYSNDSFKRPKGLMRVYRHILDELFGQ
uniref:6-Cys domain-containing protein n=1 Tax=Babesia bovis TaxID=5865 RepID=A0A0S3J406_BABBO|nr:hypothetical protein [Babesia bovis]